ncbi:hypothetical protein B9Z55_021443 [Caenorhabditis nigoni]|uniref:Uncharacterized protein n=1 Tax=Caenorhabditis nigoni TaxID=1611254 RepID=A0A2G5TS47_9PELO|nr:hypothetical protein B9Z55_021443 [Caenorhabditis nigoni]
MRLLLVILLILHNLPLKSATSIYEFSLPELQIGKNHDVQIRDEFGLLDLNHTDIRFLFHSSKFGFKNPNFIRNVSEFLLDNEFSTYNLIADATDDILENSENSSYISEKPTLWIIDFQTRDYAKIFPQFDVRQLSCDEFDFYGKNRYFQNFDLLLLETYSECGLKIQKEFSKKWDFILNSLARKWKFYDIILMETAETTNYTYSPYPEYREELSKLENMKRQRYFQNVYIDALQEMFRAWSDQWHSIEMQVVQPLFCGWMGRLDAHRFNVFYSLRKLFYFVITHTKLPKWPRCAHLPFYILHIIGFLPYPRNRINVTRQLMILEFIYIVAKYTVDDIRSVIWPFILVNEIIDLFSIFEYRTTEHLSFLQQLVKILQTFHHFLLLNQYPDFYILIWLLVIASLQIVSFFLYFFFPPLTWTVPILDIAPTQAPKNQDMIYSRYGALVFVLFSCWGLFGGIAHHTVIMLFFGTLMIVFTLKCRNLRR